MSAAIAKNIVSDYDERKKEAAADGGSMGRSGKDG